MSLDSLYCVTCFVNKVRITYICYNVWFKEFPTEHWQKIFVSLFLYLHQIPNVNENLLFCYIIIPTELVHVSLYFFMLTITQTLLILVSQYFFIITIIPTLLILVSHDYFNIALLISLNITTLRIRRRCLVSLQLVSLCLCLL